MLLGQVLHMCGKSRGKAHRGVTGRGSQGVDMWILCICAGRRGVMPPRLPWRIRCGSGVRRRMFRHSGGWRAVSGRVCAGWAKNPRFCFGAHRTMVAHRRSGPVNAVSSVFRLVPRRYLSGGANGRLAGVQLWPCPFRRPSLWAGRGNSESERRGFSRICPPGEQVRPQGGGKRRCRPCARIHEALHVGVMRGAPHKV